MGDWDAYLPSLVNGNIIGGGIFGKDQSTWIASNNCQLSQENIVTLNKCLDNKGAGQGILINGDKYINTTPPDDYSRFVRLTGPVNRDAPKNLMYCVPSERGWVVAFTNTDKANQTQLSANVHTMADHLCKSGY